MFATDVPNIIMFEPSVPKFSVPLPNVMWFVRYAPESAVEPWHFSTKSDVWSYGVTAWEIFTRAREEVPKFNVERPRERASWSVPIPAL